MPTQQTIRLRHRRDVIVIGARSAGAATAMSLARRGLDVLVVDRAPPGTDTLSSHALLRPGVVLLARWGLLDRIRAAGTPTVRSTVFHYDDDVREIPVKVDDEVDGFYAPRRNVIDPIMAEAAAEAGAEVRYGNRVVDLLREGERVTGVVVDDGRCLREIHARVVIGADGLRSSVARAVDAGVEHRARHARGFVMHYLDGPTSDAFRYWFMSSGVDAGVIPTNDDRSLAFVGVPADRFRAEVRADVAGAFDRILRDEVPALAQVIEGHARSRPRSFPGVPGFTRTAAGPGWALVGDAGCFTDPTSQHGMTSAFRDAAVLAGRVEDVVRGRLTESAAWRSYAADRDRIAIPLIDAVDAAITPGATLAEIQAGHLEMASVVRAELASLAAAPLAVAS